MKRYSSDNIVKIGKLTPGTYATVIGLNTQTGRKGIYKENGYIMGIDNNDIREKLASEILNTVGIKCADIDLVYDEATLESSCFSNYVIEDNEELVTPAVRDINYHGSEDKIEYFFQKYIEGVKEFSTDENLLKDCRKNFYNYTYMSCILDSYDLKAEHLPLVYNQDTNSYKTSPWFDFGTAFYFGNQNEFFKEMGSREVMSSLFEKHYEDIKDISTTVHTTLTPKKINELFSSNYLDELDASERIQMQARIMSQIEKSKELEQNLDAPKLTKIGKFKAFMNEFKNIFNHIFFDAPLLPASKSTYDVPASETKFYEKLSELTNDDLVDIPTIVQEKEMTINDKSNDKELEI